MFTLVLSCVMQPDGASSVMLATHSLTFCFRFSNVHGFFLVHILFQKPSETNLVLSYLRIMGKQVSSNTVILKEFHSISNAEFPLSASNKDMKFIIIS